MVLSEAVDQRERSLAYTAHTFTSPSQHPPCCNKPTTVAIDTNCIETATKVDEERPHMSNP